MKDDKAPIHHMLTSGHSNLLNITFLDIKAFDSVSHESLLLVAGRMGFPPPMLGYLGELYGDVWTCLLTDPECSELIRVSWGVRQGNPLSLSISSIP